MQSYSDGCAVVSSYNVDGKSKWRHGVVTTNGKIVVELGKYDSIYGFFNGVSIVRKYEEDGNANSAGEYGVINTEGEVVVELGAYHSIDAFDGNGLAKVYENGSGLINTTGEVIVEPGEYDEIRDFSDGLAVVKKDGKYGVINTKGEVVVDGYYSIDAFSKGYAFAITEDRKNCIINTQGEIIYQETE
jgi:hypothetical protein